MNDKKERAVQKMLRTKERNRELGHFPLPPRPTRLVQAELAVVGRPTLDDVFGGVPNHSRFPKLKPLYRSRDNLYMFYFGVADKNDARAKNGTFWWRKDTRDVPDVRAGMQFVARCRELNDTVLLNVDRAPTGDWRRGPGSTRACTGSATAFVLRGATAT